MSTSTGPWPNPWKSLQSMLPGSARREDELSERIGTLEQEIDRLREESRWRGIELDRRLNALNARVEDRESRPDPHEWRLADRIVALVLLILAAGILVPAFLTLFGVIDAAGAPVRWVIFGLSAFTLAAAVTMLVLRERLPRSLAATVVVLASVVLFVCAWIV